MLTRLIDPKKIRAFLTLTAYLLLSLLLQSLLFSGFEFLGCKGFILPAAAVAAGIYLGGVKGAVFGLFLGLLTDMNFSETTVLFTLIMPVIGFGAGFGSEFYINKSFFAYMIFAGAALLLTALMQLLCSMIIYGAELIPGLLTALMQTALSLIPAALLYLPFKNKL